MCSPFQLSVGSGVGAVRKEQLPLNLMIRVRESNKEEADVQVHTLQSGCDDLHFKDEIAKSQRGRATH